MASPRDDDTKQISTGTPASGDTRTMPAVNPGVNPAGSQTTAPHALPRPGGGNDDLGALLPMLDDPRRRFDTVMRGYDRHQVDVYVAKLEDDNRLLAGSRTENSTRVSDLAAQLASAQAEIESLRRRVAAAADVIDPDNVDVRVQEVVAAAQQLARQTRTDADSDARRVREAAQAAAETLRAESQSEADHVVAAATQRLAEADLAYTHKVGEADRYATEVNARAGEELTLARGEVAALRTATAQEIASQRHAAAEEIAAADTASSAARTEADRLSREARAQADAEAAANRRTAEEDFEITLRLRRRREEDEDRTRRAAALREATTIVGDANDTADRIVRAARAEVERLDHERHRAHTELGAIARRLDGLVTDHDPVAHPLALG